MDISSFEKSAGLAVEHFKKVLSEIRIGAASPALVENIMVECYGAQTPLLQLASIQVPEARTLVIQPWDKSVLKDIERALQTANIGASPVVEGTLVRISIPPLNEERRREVVKEISQKREEARVQLRQARDEIRAEIEAGKVAGTVTEDDKFRLFKDIDKKMQEFSEQIERLAKEKEEKVLKI